MDSASDSSVRSVDHGSSRVKLVFHALGKDCSKELRTLLVRYENHDLGFTVSEVLQLMEAYHLSFLLYERQGNMDRARRMCAEHYWLNFYTMSPAFQEQCKKKDETEQKETMTISNCNPTCVNCNSPNHSPSTPPEHVLTDVRVSKTRKSSRQRYPKQSILIG
jgi:hypothetical protein